MVAADLLQKVSAFAFLELYSFTPLAVVLSYTVSSALCYIGRLARLRAFIWVLVRVRT